MSNLHAGIREITIKNFRGIDELKLSFVGLREYPTQVVVLGGPNGSGKTSVLEAILLACGYQDAVRGKAGHEAVRAGQKDYQIDATIQVQEDRKGVRCTSAGRGQRVVPCLYFSSWRASSLPGAIGITAGKRGKRTGENRGEPTLDRQAVLRQCQGPRSLFFRQLVGLAAFRVQVLRSPA